MIFNIAETLPAFTGEHEAMVRDICNRCRCSPDDLLFLHGTRIKGKPLLTFINPHGDILVISVERPSKEPDTWQGKQPRRKSR